MSKFFINRPIVAMVIAILMVIVGVVAMLGLPIAQFPDIIPPEILVQATYPGADAQTLEESVATPLEAQISGVDNMNYMYSVNANNGQTRITVDFEIGTDPNIDQVLTQLRTSQAQSQLPAQVNTSGLIVQKSLSSPLMLLALYSPKGSYDSVFLANYAYINLVDEITRVPGVARVQVFGAGQYAMRCWVNPDRLAKLQVTVPQIVAALQSQNTVNPAGQIGGEPAPEGQQFTYAVRAQGRLLSPKSSETSSCAPIPMALFCGSKMSLASNSARRLYNLQGRYKEVLPPLSPSISCRVRTRCKAAENVRKRIAQLKARFPQDLDYQVSLDTTKRSPPDERHRRHTFQSAGPRGFRRLHLSARLARHSHPPRRRARLPHRYLRYISAPWLFH